MTPMGIIPTRQPVEDRSASLLTRPKAIPIQDLRFKTREEAFHHRVIEAVAHASHRKRNPELAAALPKGDSSIFTAVIRVMYHAARSALCASHLQRLQHELASEPTIHGPSDDDPREHIQHRR